ncbi:MAG: transposase [Desulfobacteraceae bacterium]|nr:transposase [Desulfobacteraceae bacterium]
MSNYRRAKIKGGTYFFTVVTHQRQPLLCHDFIRSALREAIEETRKIIPFKIEGWVLLPDHLHCIWVLPEGDADYGKRWAFIKKSVTKKCGSRFFSADFLNASKKRRQESSIWQRRFWEHTIRDETDFRQHMDYIHYNPVKHGLVRYAKDWPYSTFHRLMKNGMYHENWGGTGEATVDEDFGE